MVRTSIDAINALGGTAEAARLLGENVNTVSNWRVRGIPGRAHYRIAKEMEARGVAFDADALFGLAHAVNDVHRKAS